MFSATPVTVRVYAVERGRHTPGVRTVVYGVWKVAAAFAVPLRLAELTNG